MDCEPVRERFGLALPDHCCEQGMIEFGIITLPERRVTEQTPQLFRNLRRIDLFFHWEKSLLTWLGIRARATHVPLITDARDHSRRDGVLLPCLWGGHRVAGAIDAVAQFSLALTGAIRISATRESVLPG